MAALEPRRLGAAAGVGAATKASDAAFSRANPPGCHSMAFNLKQQVAKSFLILGCNSYQIRNPA